jgi:hypothetical protein
MPGSSGHRKRSARNVANDALEAREYSVVYWYFSAGLRKAIVRLFRIWGGRKFPRSGKDVTYSANTACTYGQDVNREWEIKVARKGS